MSVSEGTSGGMIFPITVSRERKPGDKYEPS